MLIDGRLGNTRPGYAVRYAIPATRPWKGKRGFYRISEGLRNRRRGPLERHNYFKVDNEKPKYQGGRIGRLFIHPHDWGAPGPIETPHVFPVINVIGGPPGPARNGGLWRPVKWWMFLNEKVPGYLCQVLHVLDFNIKDHNWGGWKGKHFGKWIAHWQQAKTDDGKPYYPPAPERHDNGYPFRKWMAEWECFQGEPGFAPQPPVTFLDSGGFTLMKKDAFQKARKWYELDTTPEAILGLQQDLGGDLIASLDYPLPPGLTKEQINERQQKSIANSIRMLELLTLDKDYETFHALPYVAVHGTNGREAEQYLRDFAQAWDKLNDKVKERPFGFAIGSMVPRADDPLTVVDVALGVRRGIDAMLPMLKAYGHASPPVHMFGITSHLMWFLVYLGVDTFDSSTFADVAKRAGYLDVELRAQRITEVSDQILDDCGCPYCAKIMEMGVLPRMKEILDPKHPRPQGRDRYYPEFWQGMHATNSDMYGLLAMHNYHRIEREIGAIRTAIKRDELAVRLVQTVASHHGQRGRRLKDTLAWLAAESGDERLRTAIRQVYHQDLQPPQRGEKPLHLRTPRRPDEFALPEDYKPPEGKKVLLLMACSKNKPYRESTHQKQVLGDLQQAYPDPTFWEQLHKVTLSGLYGPVPREREDEEPVTNYDFMLEVGDGEQAKEVAKRLQKFLRSARESYQHIFAYIYFPAYRNVVKEVFEEFGLRDQVFPQQPERGLTSIDYRKELVKAVGKELGMKNANPSADDFEVPTGYRPPAGKDILLLLPSPGRTPYGGYGDQKAVLALIKKSFPEELQRIHRVTLSALYGPVPEDMEQDAPPETTRPEATSRLERDEVEKRLRAFLASTGHHYTGGVFAYMRSPGCREMVMRVLNETNAGTLVPSLVTRQGKPTQYHQELLRHLVLHLEGEPVTQLHFAFE